MATKPEDLSDLVPVRQIESGLDEDGRVTIVESRREKGWFADLLSKGLETGHNHVKLDELGSLVWSLCDGEHTVRQIATVLAERHGDDFDPKHVRLAVFVQTMKARGWLRWKEG